MLLSRRLLRRKLSLSCLCKYVALCCVVSGLFALTCHLALNSKWRQLVEDFSSATTFPSALFKIKRGKSGVALRGTGNFLPPIEKGNPEQRTIPYISRKREKWQITFISDDSSAKFVDQKVKKLNHQLEKIPGINTRVKEGYQLDSGMNVVAKAFQDMQKKKDIPSTNQRKSLSSSKSFKVVGGHFDNKQQFQLRNSLPKTILLWTTFFGKKDWLDDEKLNCTYSGWSNPNHSLPCRISSNRADLPISDLVIMHANDIQSSFDLPKWRTPNQRWLFYCQESPKHMYLDLDNFTSLFNYTALMRRDSDYVLRHGGIVPKVKPMRKNKFVKQLAKIIASKKRLVAARISNCEPTERLKYIEELRKYIDLDFYGTCGDKKCPKFKEECNGSRMAAYKFYLAFENSNCRDYITEKFWLPLHHWNSVPIVMGGTDPEDYHRIAPPHSYINVANFASPMKLAEYLKLLDSNQTMYEQYFHWRRYYGNRRQRDDTWCRMCADLHNASIPVQYYTDLKGWYQHDACVS